MNKVIIPFLTEKKKEMEIKVEKIEEFSRNIQTKLEETEAKLKLSEEKNLKLEDEAKKNCDISIAFGLYFFRTF